MESGVALSDSFKNTQSKFANEKEGGLPACNVQRLSKLQTTTIDHKNIPTLRD
jgi:hypothetical protein